MAVGRQARLSMLAAPAGSATRAAGVPAQEDLCAHGFQAPTSIAAMVRLMLMRIGSSSPPPLPSSSPHKKMSVLTAREGGRLPRDGVPSPDASLGAGHVAGCQSGRTGWDWRPATAAAPGVHGKTVPPPEQPSRAGIARAQSARGSRGRGVPTDLGSCSSWTAFLAVLRSPRVRSSVPLRPHPGEPWQHTASAPRERPRRAPQRAARPSGQRAAEGRAAAWGGQASGWARGGD